MGREKSLLFLRLKVCFLGAMCYDVFRKYKGDYYGCIN
nr:MAG TPA: hypothetical protein [Caudoviricetes sp.]